MKCPMDENEKIDEQHEGIVPRSPAPHGEFPKEKKGCKRSCLISCIIFVLIFFVLAYISLPSILGVRRAQWQTRPKGTLRSIGSSQAAFFDQYGTYGSFEELVNAGYIPDGTTLDNWVELYRLDWENNGSQPGFKGGTFTVVAYPRDLRPGYLLTFGVSEDQIVRVYNPDNTDVGRNQYNGPTDPMVHTWDRIY